MIGDEPEDVSGPRPPLRGPVEPIEPGVDLRDVVVAEIGRLGQHGAGVGLVDEPELDAVGGEGVVVTERGS